MAMLLLRSAPCCCSRSRLGLAHGRGQGMLLCLTHGAHTGAKHVCEWILHDDRLARAASMTDAPTFASRASARFNCRRSFKTICS